MKLKRQKRYLGPDPEPPKPEAKFTQAELDAHIQKRLGEEKKKFDVTRAADLEKMKTLETDSAAKADLEKQIEDLTNRHKSKEEIASDSFKKERADWEKKHLAAESERNGWKKRYEEQTLIRELTDAAADKEADVRSAEQLVMLLRPSSRVVETLADGKPSGSFETRVSFPGKDGKPLDLLPKEVIKLMKEDPKRWGNLFNSGVASGLGGSGSKANTSESGLLSMTQDEFNKGYLKGTLPKKK